MTRWDERGAERKRERGEVRGGKRERRKVRGGKRERERGCAGISSGQGKRSDEKPIHHQKPHLLTRQHVLATFSRSVASASCQRKQRAGCVKPKVKQGSNEGTALLGGTSGVILPQLRQQGATRPECELPPAEPQRERQG